MTPGKTITCVASISLSPSADRQPLFLIRVNDGVLWHGRSLLSSNFAPAAAASSEAAASLTNIQRPRYCCHSSDQYWSWSEASSSASSAPASCAADAIAATVPCSSGCARDRGAAARAGAAGRLPVAPFAHLCSGPRFLIKASMYLQHKRKGPVAYCAFSSLSLACLAAHPVQEGVPEQLKRTNDISQHVSEARAVHDFRAARGPWQRTCP